MPEIQKVYINGLFLGQVKTGVQKFAFAICHEMAKAGVEVVFLCPKSIKQVPPFGQVKKFGNLSGHLWEQIVLPIYLKRNNIRTILNLCNSAPLLFSGNIVCVHDLSFHNYGKWFSKIYSYSYKFLTPRIIKSAKQVLTVSEFSKNQIAKTYAIAEDRIKVVYNGIYFNEKDECRNESLTKKNYILFVGSISPRKNLSMLIEAIEEIKQQDLKLVVVGKKSKIYKNTIALKSTKVKFYHQTNDAELQNFYNHAKMLVMPSFYEGFGLPVLEALSFNCPVICSDIPVFRELFEGYVSFFNVNSKEDLKQKIRSGLEEKEQVKTNTKELLRKYNYAAGARLILDSINQY